MPIANSDLITYGPFSRPQNDSGASGGAPDEQWRPTFLQLLANSTIAAVSSAADTRTVTIAGRDPTGAVVQEGIVLNGATQVSGSQVFERVHTATMSASGAQTVTVKGSGTTLGTIPEGEIGFHMLFINSASDTSIKIRYEKIFWKNDHASLTLNSAQVTLTADPESRIRIGLAVAKNDSVSVANRLSAPGGISFVDDGVAQNVPATTLEAQSLVGVWVEQNLPANDPPKKSTFTTQLTGTSV